MLRWNIVTFESKKYSIYMKRTDTVLDVLLLLKLFPPPHREVYWNCHTDSQCATVNFMIDRDRDRNVNNIIHFKCSDPALDEGVAGTVTWTLGIPVWPITGPRTGENISSPFSYLYTFPITKQAKQHGKESHCEVQTDGIQLSTYTNSTNK